MKLMYISSGKMGLFDGVKTLEIASQRVDQFIRTLRELEKQNAWKTEGEGAKFMHQTNRYANAAEHTPAVVSSLVPYRQGILYAVDLGRQTGGIYLKDMQNADAPEGLVTSAVGFYALDLSMAGGKLYLSLKEGRQSHIASMDPETGDYEMLTEGDTHERHPFCSPDGRTLYFDMCGIARDESQRIIARGPSAIAALDMRDQSISELYSDPEREYMKYTLAADGSARMLVRPYKTPRSGRNPLGCLLAPFSAIAGFVHVFSSINAARTGKKPPLQASGAEAARPMEDRLTVDGVDVDLQNVAREQQKHREEYPGLIPRDWKLVSVGSDGEQVLQHGVLDYMNLADGSYIYSNGAHVIHVDLQGKRRLLFKAHLATDLVLLDA